MDKELLKKMRKAIKDHDLDLVKNLVFEYEGLLNVSTVFGTWLHVAATHGKLDITKFLVERGMNVNQNGDINGGNPLVSAAAAGQLDIVKMLYSYGAELDVSEATKNPLFAAIYNNHVEIVKFLVENGIDITATYAIGQLDKVDACEYARQFGRTEIYNYLKEKMQ